MYEKSRQTGKKSKKKHFRDKDKDFYTQIWDSRPHQCESCSTSLAHFGNNPPSFVFSHIIAKGARQDLRYEPDNIALQCYTCHNSWEFNPDRENNFPRLYKRLQELKAR